MWSGTPVAIKLLHATLSDDADFRERFVREAHFASLLTSPYTCSKLVTLNVFEDGVRFHMSNRKNAPLFQVESGQGHVIAAVVNAAAQEYLA